jgi:hypothetical protein
LGRRSDVGPERERWYEERNRRLENKREYSTAFTSKVLGYVRLVRAIHKAGIVLMLSCNAVCRMGGLFFKKRGI